MKLVLLLLCVSFCVHYTTSSPLDSRIIPRQFIEYELTLTNRASFWDSFQKFVSKIIEDALKYIREYANKASEIVAGVHNQIQSINAIANASAQKLENDVRELMQAWQNGSEIAKNCTEMYLPLLTEVVQTYQVETGICIQNASVTIQEISDAIRPNIDQLMIYIKELQSLIETCFRNSSNIFEGISCVIGKGNQLHVSIMQVVEEIKKIISVSSNKGFELVKVTGKCMNAAIDKYQMDIVRLQQDYKNCVLGGFWCKCLSHESCACFEEEIN